MTIQEPAASPLSISVVIPTYNRSKMLREAIDAALQQTRPPDEVVVSDDCSPDDTALAMEALAKLEPRLRFIRQPKNLKGVENWNAVIRASKGDLIAFCTDDDLFLPHHLEQAAGYLERHPEVGMVHAWFDGLETQADDSVKLVRYPVPRRRTSVTGEDAVWYMMEAYSWPFHAATLVFRRSLWEETGPFDPRFQLADTGWWLRATLQHRVDLLPEAHVLNRRHRGNWSNSVGAAKMHDEVNRMVLETIERLGEAGVPPQRRAFLRAVWTWFHRYRVSRLVVARGRAGAAEPCAESLALLLESFPLGAQVPAPLTQAAARGVAAALSTLQRVLPGGREKYASLGVSVPR